MNDIHEPPSRGGQPRYLDRAMTPAERQRLRAARRKRCLNTVERHVKVYTQKEVDALLAEARKK